MSKQLGGEFPPAHAPSAPAPTEVSHCTLPVAVAVPAAGAERNDWLASLLSELRLSVHLPKFRAEKPESLQDIREMGRQTLSSLGLTSTEAKRLQRGVAEDDDVESGQTKTKTKPAESAGTRRTCGLVATALLLVLGLMAATAVVASEGGLDLLLGPDSNSTSEPAALQRTIVTAVDDCASAPCLNGGACTQEHPTGYTCACPDGCVYTGTTTSASSSSSSSSL